MIHRIIDPNLIPKFSDLTSITEGHSLEPMVALSDYGITTDIENEGGEEMKEYTGTEIFVRLSVATRMQRVDGALFEKGYKSVVTYGYRHGAIQMKNFKDITEKLSGQKTFETKEALYEAAHNFIAVPSVAGHPTGGALDAYLQKLDGSLVDMGTMVDDYDQPDKIITFSNLITAEQTANRMILREAMLEEGFVPFNGEWWHFSYGDKEWAFMVGLTQSLYSQIEFTFKKATTELS